MYRCLVSLFAIALLSACMRHHDRPLEVRNEDASVATPPPILSGGQHCTGGTVPSVGSGPSSGAADGAGSSNDTTCDNVDDDCDGITDEGVPNIDNLDTPCSAGMGACQASGKWLCNAAGTRLVCSATPHLATTESCNGIDDDCNGVVDDIAATCLDSDDLQTCSSTGPSTYSCSTNDGNTCYQGDCTGNCIAGTWSCVDGANARTYCQLNGTPDTPENCPSLSANYFELCREGGCVESTIVPFGFNDTSGSQWGTSIIGAGRWMLMQLVIPEDIWLFSLKVQVVTGVAGLRMAIFNERAETFTQPNEVAYLSDPKSSTNSGWVTFDNPSRSRIPAGTYWLGLNAVESVTVHFRQSTTTKYYYHSLSYSTVPTYHPGWGGDSLNGIKAQFPTKNLLVPPSTGEWAFYLTGKTLL